MYSYFCLWFPKRYCLEGTADGHKGKEAETDNEVTTGLDPNCFSDAIGSIDQLATGQILSKWSPDVTFRCSKKHLFSFWPQTDHLSSSHRKWSISHVDIISCNNDSTTSKKQEESSSEKWWKKVEEGDHPMTGEMKLSKRLTVRCLGEEEPFFFVSKKI